MAEEEKPLPPKLDVARYLLAQGSLFVHLDPRVDTVRVPDWYRSEPQLVLQIGFDMPVPIRDLEVDADGIYGTLSFNRSPFVCQVQWDAVFALAADQNRTIASCKLGQAANGNHHIKHGHAGLIGQRYRLLCLTEYTNLLIKGRREIADDNRHFGVFHILAQ